MNGVGGEILDSDGLEDDLGAYQVPKKRTYLEILKEIRERYKGPPKPRKGVFSKEDPNKSRPKLRPSIVKKLVKIQKAVISSTPMPTHNQRQTFENSLNLSPIDATSGKSLTQTARRSPSVIIISDDSDDLANFRPKIKTEANVQDGNLKSPSVSKQQLENKNKSQKVNNESSLSLRFLDGDSDENESQNQHKSVNKTNKIVNNRSANKIDDLKQKSTKKGENNEKTVTYNGEKLVKDKSTKAKETVFTEKKKNLSIFYNNDDENESAIEENVNPKEKSANKEKKMLAKKKMSVTDEESDDSDDAENEPVNEKEKLLNKTRNRKIQETKTKGKLVPKSLSSNGDNDENEPSNKKYVISEKKSANTTKNDKMKGTMAKGIVIEEKILSDIEQSDDNDVEIEPVNVANVNPEEKLTNKTRNKKIKEAKAKKKKNLMSITDEESDDSDVNENEKDGSESRIRNEKIQETRAKGTVIKERKNIMLGKKNVSVTDDSDDDENEPINENENSSNKTRNRKMRETKTAGKMAKKNLSFNGEYVAFLSSNERNVNTEEKSANETRNGKMKETRAKGTVIEEKLLSDIEQSDDSDVENEPVNEISANKTRNTITKKIVVQENYCFSKKLSFNEVSDDNDKNEPVNKKNVNPQEKSTNTTRNGKLKETANGKRKNLVLSNDPVNINLNKSNHKTDTENNQNLENIANRVEHITEKRINTTMEGKKNKKMLTVQELKRNSAERFSKLKEQQTQTTNSLKNKMADLDTLSDASCKSNVSSAFYGAVDMENINYLYKTLPDNGEDTSSDDNDGNTSSDGEELINDIPRPWRIDSLSKSQLMKNRNSIHRLLNPTPNLEPVVTKHKKHMSYPVRKSTRKAASTKKNYSFSDSTDEEESFTFITPKRVRKSLPKIVEKRKIDTKVTKVNENTLTKNNSNNKKQDGFREIPKNPLTINNTDNDEIVESVLNSNETIRRTRSISKKNNEKKAENSKKIDICSPENSGENTRNNSIENNDGTIIPEINTRSIDGKILEPRVILIDASVELEKSGTSKKKISSENEENANEKTVNPPTKRSSTRSISKKNNKKIDNCSPEKRGKNTRNKSVKKNGATIIPEINTQSRNGEDLEQSVNLIDGSVELEKSGGSKKKISSENEENVNEESVNPPKKKSRKKKNTTENSNVKASQLIRKKNNELGKLTCSNGLNEDFTNSEFNSTGLRRSSRTRRPPKNRFVSTVLIVQSERELKKYNDYNSQLHKKSEDSTKTWTSSTDKTRRSNKSVNEKSDKKAVSSNKRRKITISEEVSTVVSQNMPTITENSIELTENLSNNIDLMENASNTDKNMKTVSNGKISKTYKKNKNNLHKKLEAVLSKSHEVADDDSSFINWIINNESCNLRWITRSNFNMFQTTTDNSDIGMVQGSGNPVEGSNCGFIKIEPFGTKAKRMSSKFTLYFCKIQGKAMVGVHDQVKELNGPLDEFMVPKGQSYFIKNLDDGDLIFYFVRFISTC